MTKMRATTLLTSAALFAVASYGIALAAEAMPASIKAMAGMLEDAKGMTLYTWDNDKEANKSSCNGMCLMNWPALKAEASDKDMGDWKVITRDDGSKQWAYKGKPLYYFVMDAAPGDKKGEGRGMVWHMAHM
jgi:predicted lipoprotein with Yx(FWY)xxD motif